VSLEKDLINYLASDPSQIENGLELKEKEYDTKTVGHIDLLCTDKNRDFVVVETKKGKDSDKVVGPIQRYMGWINRNLAKSGENVRGIIIDKIYLHNDTMSELTGGVMQWIWCTSKGRVQEKLYSML
jgi:RecB family endonuclease NucS